MKSLFVRAVIAFLALPGIVAYVIPVWVLRGVERDVTGAGVVVVAAGTLVLLQCVRDFYVAGRGTLAPWSPPRHLVTTGLYRYSRNPMYVGVVLILIGWALTFRSTVHAVYAVAIAVAFHLRVVMFEEPWLASTHGRDWESYRARVPRRFVW